MPATSHAGDLLRVIVERCRGSTPCVVATVLCADGSTPVKAGARAVLDGTGAVLAGTIGGGAVEAEAQRQAPAVLQSGRALVFDFSLRGAGPEVEDPICGGAMRVLLDPVPAKHLDAWEAAASAVFARQRGALLMDVPGDSITPDGAVRWIGEEAVAALGDFPGSEAVRSVLRSETTSLFEQEGTGPHPRRGVLVEPLLPRPRLLIVGGGHVGQAVAQLAGPVGFEIAVLDDRAEFTRPVLYPPDTQLLCGEIRAEVASFPLAEDAYIVIVTRGHSHDAAALAACVRRPCAYLGMIGSRRKVALMRQEFIAKGLATPEEFDRVCAPIGLDIGAVTVPEIATSIVAQLIAVRRHRSAGRMPRADEP